MSAAGQLRERFRFEAKVRDDNGDRVGPDYEVLFFARARLQFLHGTEEVMGERLEGRQPVILTIRSCRAARALTTEARAVDARNPARVFNIKGVELDEAAQWIDVLAVSRGGGTVG